MSSTCTPKVCGHQGLDGASLCRLLTIFRTSALFNYSGLPMFGSAEGLVSMTHAVSKSPINYFLFLPEELKNNLIKCLPTSFFL